MRLTWQEIKRSFRDQWIELNDVEWDESFLPISAVVANSGYSRTDLSKSKAEDSIVIFIGAAKGFVPMSAGMAA
jgi:hypothetical protein